MIFITDELGKFEKNIIELAENVGFKECKTIEAIDLFCGISERNDVLKEKDRYYAFIDIPQYWSVRADGLRAHTADILTIQQMSWHGSRASTIICCMMIFQDKQINVAGHTVRCEQ